MRALISVLVLLCTVPAALTGCGGSKLLDQQSAKTLQASLQEARAAVDRGECAAAAKAAATGTQQVERLPGDVDDRLVARLREGFQTLQDRIRRECSGTTIPTPTTETTDTTTTETTDTSTQTTDTTTTPSTDTTTTTTPTVPTTPTTPDGSGGVDPGASGDTGVPRSFEGARQRLKDAAKQARKDARKALKDLRDAAGGNG
jgi:activator of HSP90 ATPase